MKAVQKVIITVTILFVAITCRKVSLWLWKSLENSRKFFSSVFVAALFNSQSQPASRPFLWTLQFLCYNQSYPFYSSWCGWQYVYSVNLSHVMITVNNRYLLLFLAPILVGFYAVPCSHNAISNCPCWFSYCNVECMGKQENWRVCPMFHDVPAFCSRPECFKIS